MRKPGWLLSPSFCLDAISLSFNIFIHSLLFSFISQLILFIICPYLQAWQSILHSASADRWKNDPCLTLPSITSLLPSLRSSWSPSETRLTACYISSSHSNPSPPHPCDRAFSLQCALFPSSRNVVELQPLGMRQKRGDIFKTIEPHRPPQSLTPFICSPLTQIYFSLCFLTASFCRCCMSAHISLCHILPVHIDTILPEQDYSTGHRMDIQNCWWLRYAPHTLGRVRVQCKEEFPLPPQHFDCFICLW